MTHTAKPSESSDLPNASDEEYSLPRAEALCRNEAMRAAVAELQGLAGPLEQAGGAIRLDLTKG